MADLNRVDLPYPLFAKPVAEGSSKGVNSKSKARNRAELAAICRDLLKQFAQPVLVETFLPGREFTVVWQIKAKRVGRMSAIKYIAKISRSYWAQGTFDA